MSGKKNHGNNSKRFALYSFYALLKKTKIVQLLDKDGNSPYDSDAMRNSVWEYAANLYKDITDIGQMVSYHDSDDIGPGSIPQKDEITFILYDKLKKSLYSLSNNNGIDNTENTITSGFERRYYTVPVSDSDGTLRHTNILLFLKSHLDRWLRYDSFERFKLTSRIMDNLDVDSDLRNRYADNFLKSCEEDSDLSRRVVELYSNVIQTDSEVRNEILRTAITALSGLTPGGDSDAARAITEVISGVYETDSEVRNEFGDHILLSLQNDSDQQTELGDILSSTEIPLIQAIDLIARNLLPMDGDGSGTIGDSDQRWARAKFTKIKVDNLKPNNIQSSQVVTVSDDSESRLIGSDNLKFLANDSDNPLLYKGLRQIAIDSDTFYRLLIENEDAYTLDSDSVVGVIRETPVKSEIAWPIGQVGDVYVIDRLVPDSEFTNTYDSELDSYFADAHGTNLNWTSRDATWGNMIDMFSNPGTNDFREANTTKPGGFKGATDITFAINGYGYHGFIMLPTNASLEASNEYANSMPGSPAYIWTKTEPGSGGFYVYFANGAGATSGLVSITAYWEGSTLPSTINVPGVTANYYGGAYPVRFRIGRDNDGAIWCQTIGDGSSNTTTLSPKYYIDSTNNITATPSTKRKMNPDIGVQYAYGNYDGGPAEKMTNIIVRDTVITPNYTNSIETKKLIFTSDKVTNTAPELARALGDTVTKQQVFNTWYRISHRWNGGGTPGTFTYPANPSEQNSWAFDAANDVIYTTANTTTFCGFISSDTYDDFTFNSIVNAPYSGIADTNDDDSIISIVGFVTEGTYGQAGYREHTLSLVRTHGGFPLTSQGGPNVTWCLVYNYNQDDNRLLVNKSSSAPIATSPWNTSPYGSKLFIRRKGDSIVAYCSQMNDSTYTLDSDTEIVWDLASDSDTLKFRGPVKYGYGAHSQQGSYWSDIFFKPDIGQYLHHVPAGTLGSVGGSVYEYDPDTTSWVQDSDLTVDNTVGHRFLHNTSTKKTFYNNSTDDKIYDVMTAAKFTDVMRLPALDSEPTGVIGMVARADGDSEGWDPSNLNQEDSPYLVFYSNDSDGWQRFVLS